MDHGPCSAMNERPRRAVDMILCQNWYPKWSLLAKHCFHIKKMTFICGGEIKWLTPAPAALTIRDFLRCFNKKLICQSTNRLRGTKNMLQMFIIFF